MILFNHYFNRDSSEDMISDYYFEGERFSWNHDNLGKLDFYSPAIHPVSTSKGSLYLISYIPGSPASTQACALLASRQPPGALKLAPWPEKPVPASQCL